MHTDEYGEDDLLSKHDQYSDVYVLFVRIAYATRLCQPGWKQIFNVREQIQKCIDRKNELSSDRSSQNVLSFDQISVGIRKYSLQELLQEDIRHRAKHLSIMIAQGNRINRSLCGVIDSYEGNAFKIQIFDKQIIENERNDFVFIPSDRVKVESILQKFANKYATHLKRLKPNATDKEIKTECLRVWYDYNNPINIKNITRELDDSDFYIQGIAFKCHSWPYLILLWTIVYGP